MTTKRREQRTTNTPLSIVTTKQHTRHYTWGEAPVSTWTRQPSGVVQGGGGLLPFSQNSSSLMMQQVRGLGERVSVISHEIKRIRWETVSGVSQHLRETVSDRAGGLHSSAVSAAAKNEFLN